MIDIVRRINAIEGEDLVMLYKTDRGYLIRENRKDSSPLMVALSTEDDVIKYLLKLEQRQKERLEEEE